MALITSSGARGLCPVCGADKGTCGDSPDVTPVDAPVYLKSKERTMTEPVELNEYTWDQNGQEMTGRLSAADAERLGARPAGDSGASGADGEAGSPDEQARTKARKAQNK